MNGASTTPWGPPLALPLAVVLAASGLCAAAGSEDWKFDILRLTNGNIFQGLLVEETPAEIRFRCVRRNPGAPTVVIATTFQRAEVASLEKLDAADRRVLEARLKALDPTGKGEMLRMESLELQPVPWIRPGAGEALRYDSVHFVLISNAREDIVRRAAVRLEQIYAAYTRFLPPRHRAGKPTTIYLVRSRAEYQALLKEQKRTILNPAFYDATLNQILCASDLQALGDQLEKVRRDHQQILDELKKNEADLAKVYRGKIPAAIRDQLAAKRLEVYAANQKNEGIFKEATRHLFQTLYHEAFHAYLANFVYPPGEAEVPRWLNEGLAQIFETALVEAGELRVGHADPERLQRLKGKGRGELVPLAQLLRAGPRKFLVNPTSDQLVSDRYYLNSWALSFYLTFERRLLGTPALDRYVRDLKGGADRLAAFEELVGQPLSQFEPAFRDYARRLRPNGSTARLTPGK